MHVDIGRYLMLRDSVAGYRATGVPLTALNNGRIIAAGGSDDIGLYYVTAKLSKWGGVGLDATLYVFFFGAIALCVGLGVLGFVLLWHRRPDQIASIVALVAGSLLAYLTAGDVYMLPFFVPIMIVPWVLYFRRTTSLLPLTWLAVCVGLIVGLSRSVRLDSALPSFCFTLLMFAFAYVVRWRLRVLLISILLVTVLLPGFFFKRQLAYRDAFLAARDHQYTAPTGHHVVWHDVYIGLGFLSNPYIAGYCDEEAAKAVRSVSATTRYASSEYESIIRGKVFELLRRDPKFVLFTLFSKVAITIFMFVVCCNLGLIAAIRYPKPWGIELAFWAAILFSSIAPILTVPLPKYSMSVIAFAILYGISSWAMCDRDPYATDLLTTVQASSYSKDAIPSR